MKAEKEVKQLILDYLKDNPEVLEETAEELDGYSDVLGDNRHYCMEELDELFVNVPPVEILTRAFYGYDDDSKTVDKWGREEPGAFNPKRNYFYFNGYGNLVSTDYKDYSMFLDEYLIEELFEYRHQLYLDARLEELLEELEEIIEE